MLVSPYLHFNGRCDEAIEFYKAALGAEVTMLMRFKDAPKEAQAGMTPGSENKVMHANLKVGDTAMLLSDGHCTGQLAFEGFSLSLTVATVAEADKYFAALSAGGQVQMPLGPTFFSPKFGMLADKFGVGWMVYVAPPGAK